MFYVHRSDRADCLLAELGRDLAANPLADPMASELICVPSRGIERWISQGLADHIGVGSAGGDGISANIDFRPPGALIADVIDQVGRVEDQRQSWQSANLLWAVAQAVDANVDESWLDLVSKQISAGALEGRTDRMATMQYIANLFDRYHWQRPDMIVRWHAGEDADAGYGTLAPEAAWQPRLWREVRSIINSPSPPEILASAKQVLESKGRELDLPERISIFGLTRLPLGQLGLLRSLAEVLDVHLYVLHPSPPLWAETAARLKGTEVDVSRTLDGDLDITRHPLLSSWSRDSRELQVAIASLDAVEADNYELTPDVPVASSGSLLARLQADIRSNQPPKASDAFGPAGRSLQIHSCHGPARQVEVLRDAILHTLSDDPTIEARDIVVMCPDIETYAPHINATFASVPELRIRLADRAFSQTNPYMAATAQLLRLVAARCSSAEVLSFLSAPPVRARFDLSDDDVATIHDWVERSGVRWGLSQRHRQAGHWGSAEANTWRAGVQRLALGVAMSDSDNRLIAGTRPLSEVDSTDIELVGKLAEFVSELESAIDRLGDTYTVTDGLATLADVIDALMSCSIQDSWQRASMFELLEGLRGPALDSYGAKMQVSINEFRDLFVDELEGRPSRANFRSGGVTFCTLTPMRSVPHRVVCLLGMDDDVFPRLGRRQGDDVTRSNQRVGDYDPRSEDRQLLLDATMAAQQRLIVTYSGRDERTNEEMRPAVPIDELVTVLKVMIGGEHSQSIVTEHPLQGFDSRNFVPGALVPDRPWSFDALDFGGSQRLLRRQELPRLFMESTLPAVTPDLIEIDDLIKFVKHPIKAFFQSRIRLTFEDYDDEMSEEFPTEIDHLVRWKLGTELLAELERCDGDPAELAKSWCAATIASGLVPPGLLSVADLNDVSATAIGIDAARRRLASGPAQPRTVVVPIPELGLEVRGVVTCTTPAEIVQTTVSKVTESRVAGISAPRVKALAGLWVSTLALACASGEEVRGIVIGKGHGKGPDAKPEKIEVTSPEAPHSAMVDLVRLYLESMRHPAWLFAQTSLSFASADVRRAEAVTNRVWTSDFKFDKEDIDPYHLFAYGPLAVKDLLVEEDFRRAAHQMWGPVLRQLTVEEVPDV